MVVREVHPKDVLGLLGQDLIWAYETLWEKTCRWARAKEEEERGESTNAKKEKKAVETFAAVC